MSTTQAAVCPTNKKCFSSFDEATEWEASNRDKYPSSPKQTAYACEDCRFYHLSSLPKGYHNQMSSSQKIGSIIRSQAPQSKRPSIDGDEVRKLRATGLSVRHIAERMGATYAAIHYHCRMRDGRVRDKKVRGAGREYVAAFDLDGIAKQRQELERELAKLVTEENRIREYKELRVVPCWDGKGLLIKKEGNQFAVTLEDAPLLAEKLLEVLTSPRTNGDEVASNTDTTVEGTGRVSV